MICRYCDENFDCDELALKDNWTICHDCYAKARNNKFQCQTCTEEFTANGIALQCPKCGSFNIDTDQTITDRWIKEAFDEEIRKLEAEPLETMKIIEAMKIGDVWESTNWKPSHPR